MKGNPQSSLLRNQLIVFLTSCTMLCYEITLVRVYALLQWQDFYATIISMAMLGIGVSGSLLYILRKRIDANPERWTLISLILYPLTLFSGFIITCKLPFIPFLLGHEPFQIVYLLVALICMIVPFGCGATVFGILMQRYTISKLYFQNLSGAGTGALIIIGVLYFLHPFHALVLLSGVAFTTAVIYSSIFSKKTVIAVASGVLILQSFFVFTFAVFDLKKISEYKELSQTLSMKNAAILYEKYSPLGTIQVAKADGLRNFTGMSMIAPAVVPQQYALFFDGEGMIPITPYSNDTASIRFLAYTTSAIPYVLSKSTDSVLVIGGGGGEGILRALYFASKNIDVQESNPQVIRLMENELADFSGNIYSHTAVQSIQSDPRAYIGTTSKTYHLIEIPLSNTASSASTGVHSLDESYLYTQESIENM